MFIKRFYRIIIISCNYIILFYKSSNIICDMIIEIFSYSIRRLRYCKMHHKRQQIVLQPSFVSCKCRGNLISYIEYNGLFLYKLQLLLLCIHQNIVLHLRYTFMYTHALDYKSLNVSIDVMGL